MSSTADSASPNHSNTIFEIMKAIDLEAALIGLALAVAWAAATIARTLLVPVVALMLTFAGWRPRPGSARIRPSEAFPVPAQPGRPLVDLTVAQLRGMARQAGFKALANTGRRSELLAVLSVPGVI